MLIGTYEKSAKEYITGKLKEGVIANGYYVQWFEDDEILEVYEGNDISGELLLSASMKPEGSVVWNEKVEKRDPNKIRGAHYLYYKGEEYAEEGGLWENNEKLPESQKGTLSKEEAYMVFEAGKILESNPTCTKAEPIDISEYGKICIEIEVERETGSDTANIGMSIWNAKNPAEKIKEAHYYHPSAGEMGTKAPIGEKMTISLDLLDLSMGQLKNVYFGLSINGYAVKIHSIYLMKAQRTSLYLYKPGDECISVGGHWQISNFGEPNHGEFSNTLPDYLLLTGKYCYYSNFMIGKEEALDLTGYRFLNATIEVEGVSDSHENRNTYMKLLDKSGNVINNSVASIRESGNDGVMGQKEFYTISLNGLTNPEAYVIFDSNSYKIRIYEVWLEQ